jgi:acetyltransferase-like isoleucine patch superfamily enzyme
MSDMLREMIQRFRYWRREDRISPENPLTHWRLFFHGSMTALCRKKFRQFGEGAEFRPYAFASGCSNISIGRKVVVRPNTMLYAHSLFERGGLGAITIEDDVLLGPAILIFTGKHIFSDPHAPIREQGVELPKNVVIKQGAWVGAGTIIVGGVTIGENAVIGAGSVVTKDIPDGTLAVGAPAKVIRSPGEALVQSRERIGRAYHV